MCNKTILLFSFICFFELTFESQPSKDHMEEGMMKEIVVIVPSVLTYDTGIDVFCWVFLSVSIKKT